MKWLLVYCYFNAGIAAQFGYIPLSFVDTQFETRDQCEALGKIMKEAASEEMLFNWSCYSIDKKGWLW